MFKQKWQVVKKIIVVAYIVIVLRSPSSVLSSTVWILKEKRRFLVHTTVLQKQRLMLAFARSISQVVASSILAEGPGGGLLRSMVPI